MESLNFKGVEMKNVMEKLARWTGKTIIPSEEAMKVKLTIYAPDKLPRSKALAMIYSALRMNGFVAETSEDMIFLKSIKDDPLKVYVVAADEELAQIANKEQIVQKLFQLDNYSPQQMASIIGPLVGEHGQITADESAGALMVIDTVSNLMRLQRIIDQFDIPEAAPTVTRVFEIKHGGDPSEIVQMLNILLGEGASGSISRYDRDRDRYRGSSYSGRYYPRPNPQPVQSSSSRKSTGSATSVLVGEGTGPIILIPEPRRSWIIARASAEDMERIAEWIERLDKEEPIESDYEVVDLRYADPSEIEDSVGDGFRDLPGTQFLPSVLIEPLRQTKQVIVFGRKDLREIVKKMIKEIDVPPGMYETRHFPLDYADPDQIKTMLEELFSQQGSSSSPYSSRYYGGYYGSYYGSSRYRSSSSSTDQVTVISYPTLKQVTVITSPEKMVEVAKQIEEWDQPLDVESVRPRIIELKNSDPIEMADLLKKLFSEETSSRTSLFDLLYRGGMGDTQSKIVGPLYGQLTFESVPGTKKIIVISKIPEAYDVIEKLILDLDREEMGEIPEVIEIKYADVEDLCERLNAMFVEAGQQARIRLTSQGLSDASSMDITAEGGAGGGSSGNNSSEETYTPPWSGSGARGRLDENMPISNVIGRIRFVPEPHTKSIMVLAPPEFMDEIRQLIEQLDVPGKQVIIEVIIVGIEHTKATSLGVQLATNPAAFGTLEENAIVALTNITGAATHGSASGRMPTAEGQGASGSGTIITSGTDIYAMIDFLIKTTNAQVLNQQTLWTKDNEEANFFKGSEVAFLGSESITQNTTTQNVDFELVGMELRARPSITPENNVDMIVNVQLSQLTAELVNEQPVRDKMNTTTNMIVKSNETLLLGGYLFQTDSAIRRKVPGLGDLPLVGGLFRHDEKVRSNVEVLVFMTPRVVDDTMEDLPEYAPTKEAIDQPRERLKGILGELDEAVEGLDQ
jgi:general secretion pathway protein D